MASSRRAKTAKKPLLRVELSGAGLLGVVVVLFCIFVWMFIFGVWTGQALLADASLAKRAAALLDRGREEPPTAPADSHAAPAAVRQQTEPAATKKAAKKSYFAIQVAAFKRENLARQEVARWRARGYDAFYLRPRGPETSFHPVLVGRFVSMDKANLLASRIEADRHGKVFITQVDGGRERLPR